MVKKFSKALAVLLSAVMTVSVMSAAVSSAVGVAMSAARFTDVPSDSWFYNAVTACAEKGYVTGVGNGEFSPDGQVTYAQFAVMAFQAFYPGDLTLEAPWYVPYITAGQRQGIFEGTMAGIPTATTPLTRYEMAQIAANILAGYGKTADPARVAEIQQSITDWADIPANYQSAVVTCFDLGVLSGYADGRFGGTDTLTRAQACVILNSLEKAAEGAGFQPITPARPENPPAGDDSPKLANGKDITEENVLEILAQLQLEYPDGTTWGPSGTANNNWYKGGAGNITQNLILVQYKTNSTYACGGWAAMVSDRIFGKTENPAHRVTDPMNIRPGDIIIELINGKVDHIAVAATATIQSGNYKGMLWTTEGNINGHVIWPDYEYGMPGSEAFAQQYNPGETWEVWSRYPD